MELPTGRPPLLCFSHLRWDFVWQRPQQLMTRFARDRRVYFVEEPLYEADAGEPARGGVLRTRACDGVVFVQPVCRDPGPEGGWRLEAMYRRLLPELVAREGLAGYTAWFFSPMFLPAIDRLDPALVVYDAMDELSLFKDGLPVLLERERGLLERAGVVFTGGVSLGRAKAKLHPNVHPFPSGVEAEHYRRALRAETPLPDDLQPLPAPRLGYVGVIDERLDPDLVAAVADARPDWSLVLVGPVRKIEVTDLPRRPNLHYLGQKAYRDLPAYVKGFDVCLMPFALNAATRFISPTKTLEYMAAHKPIVSTPVADVVGAYGGAVRIAAEAQAFVAEAQAALGEPEAARAARIVAERVILARSSWDAIAGRMDERMAQALQARARRLPPARPEAPTTASPIARPAARTVARAAVLDVAGD
jgi:UDP-galactopyranose mutase